MFRLSIILNRIRAPAHKQDVTMTLLTRAWLVSPLVISVLIMAPVACAVENRVDSAAASQCVRCHTRVKGLIRLSWAVEKLRPKPVRSAETSGEG